MVWIAPNASLFAMAKGKTKKVSAKSWRKNYVREWRKFRGFTLEELGELSGYSAGQISVLERSESGYSYEMLEALAAALKCRPGDLLDSDPSLAPSLFRLMEDATEAQRQTIESVARAIVKPKE